MMNINEIYFYKRNAILIKENPCDNEKELVDNVKIATILKNLEYYGYTLSENIINKLKTLSTNSVVEVYKELIDLIENAVGNKAKLEPLYKNFPKEVMEKDEVELYIDAIIYFLTSFEVTPMSERETKYPLLQVVDLKVIELGSEEDFMSIFTNLVSSKSSISEQDKDVLKFFVENYKEEVLKYLPEEIPFKEILAYTTMLCMELNGAIEYFIPKYKSATDVLRLATAMSNGDVSLAKNTRFVSFNRRERRFLLNLLENTNKLEENMNIHKNKWIKLGEKLHPSEYRNLKKVNKAFYAIRNGVKIETFNSLVEKAFNEEKVDEVLSLLKSKPGEFARKLDRMLRTFDNEKVLSKFKEVAHKVPTPLLLEVREHFLRRNDNDLEERVFFPKGSIAKAYVIPYELKEIDKSICEKVVSICTQTLVRLYSEREPLGKVYVSGELRNYIVPTTLRNSSRAVRTIARGSKMPLFDNTNIIRLFLYWKDPKGDMVDLDLSSVFFNEEFEYIDNIYFRNLREKKYNCVHSGDVRQAPNGATEFIDLDLNALLENGIRYIVSSVHSYSGQPYLELPECFVGFMERENGEFGEIFEPKTVTHKADLTSNNQVVIPLVIDILERRVIWTDLSGDAVALSSVGRKGEQLRLLSSLKSMLNIRKPNMFDLMVLNAIARGQITFDKEEADTIFSLTEGVTPFDTDIILSKYL